MKKLLVLTGLMMSSFIFANFMNDVKINNLQTPEVVKILSSGPQGCENMGYTYERDCLTFYVEYYWDYTTNQCEPYVLNTELAPGCNQSGQNPYCDYDVWGNQYECMPGGGSGGGGNGGNPNEEAGPRP